MMGGMMGIGMGAWVLIWTLLSIAVVVACVVVVPKALKSQHKAERTEITPSGSRDLLEAKNALRRRYAAGEIDREEYLQGKVELED